MYFVFQSVQFSYQTLVMPPKKKNKFLGNLASNTKKVHGLETKNLVLEAELEVLEKRKLELEVSIARTQQQVLHLDATLATARQQLESKQSDFNQIMAAVERKKNDLDQKIIICKRMWKEWNNARKKKVKFKHVRIIKRR